MNKWYNGIREYHTPGGGVSALLKPTAPERYHQSYCVYVRGVCPRWKINCGKKCSLLYICRLCMVVFSKQITLLIHIIIHTNGTIKKITSRIIHWKKKKFQPSMVLTKKFCLWKHIKKIFQPDQNLPPPPWKSNGRSLMCINYAINNIQVRLCLSIHGSRSHVNIYEWTVTYFYYLLLWHVTN